MLRVPKQPDTLYPKCRPERMLEQLAIAREVSVWAVAESLAMTEHQLRTKVAKGDAHTLRRASWSLGTWPWMFWMQFEDDTVQMTIAVCGRDETAPVILPCQVVAYNQERATELERKAVQTMNAQLFNLSVEDQKLVDEHKALEYVIPEPGYTRLDPEPWGPRPLNTRTQSARWWALRKRDHVTKEAGLPPAYNFSELGWSWDAPYIVWILRGWTLDMLCHRGYVKYSTRSSMPPGYEHQQTRKKKRLARERRKR